MGCITRVVSPFRMTIPSVYDDSLTFYETVCTLIQKLCEYAGSTNATIEELQAKVNELYDFVHGTTWEDAICAWVNQNLPCIVAQTCKWFHFGINDNGNVVCTIPLTWQDFNISWNMDFGSPDFGRLTIGW